MYGKEKTGLRRLWDCNKTVFAAAVVALVAVMGQLAASYLFYLPDFAHMKPFTFLMYTVIRWVLLSTPAYLLSAYLEDHYGTAQRGRFFITPFVSAGLVAVALGLNWKGYFQGFLAISPGALAYSIAMSTMLLLPVVCGLCHLKSWKPLPVWIAAGVCAIAMVGLAVISLMGADFQNFAMALSYIALCVAYSLAMPKILTDVGALEEEAEADIQPAEKPIMKDEE